MTVREGRDQREFPLSDRSTQGFQRERGERWGINTGNIRVV